MSKIEREKFTTTLNPDVLTRLGVIKAINKNKGLNEVIEELVNNKFKEMGLNDANNKERQKA